MKRHGLTLNGFAKVSGVGQNVLHRAFVSDPNPGLKLGVVERICKPLGIELRTRGDCRPGDGL